HNGISRLYETFGNGGTAETVDRTLSPAETERTWFKQNPPLPHVKWSLRNNNNYEQTGILVSLNYVANNRLQLLRNFYEKSKRSHRPRILRRASRISRPGATSSAWTSRIRASPTRSSTFSSGARTIRRRIHMTTRGGRSRRASGCRPCASPTSKCWTCPSRR